jgi:hypothetical protein
METGFALTAFLAVILNLIIPEEIEDEEVPELTANTIDEKEDQEEWERIRRPSRVSQRNSSVVSSSVPNGVHHEKTIAEEPEKETDKTSTT